MTLAARTLLTVAAGGAVGSLLRWLVDVLLPAAPGTVPWGTLLVNVLGSGVLAVVVVVLPGGRGSHLSRAFLSTGVLGGFTTFSTYAMQVSLLGEGAPVVALTYLMATPLLCVVAASVAAALVPGAWRTP